MTTDDELPTPQAVRPLVQVDLLLCRVEVEAAAIVVEMPGFAQCVLAGALQDLSTGARVIFPEGVMPAFEHTPVATTVTHPVQLAREAERLTREHPIADFLPGMSPLNARTGPPRLHADPGAHLEA